MHDRIWLSFDLSPQGDREGMYRWLARQEARECGPGLASMVFHYQADLIEELRNALKKALNLGASDRVYVIYKDPEDGETICLFIHAGIRPS